MGSSTASARDPLFFKNTMLPAPTGVCVEHCLNASLAAVKDSLIVGRRNRFLVVKLAYGF